MGRALDRYGIGSSHLDLAAVAGRLGQPFCGPARQLPGSEIQESFYPRPLPSHVDS